MTNTFIPTFGRQRLYCAWVKTGNPRQPLACVWIDPELRSFQFDDGQGTTAADVNTDEYERQRTATPFAKELLFATQTWMVAPAGEKTEAKARLMMKPLSRVLVVLCLLLNSAWADGGGKDRRGGYRSQWRSRCGCDGYPRQRGQRDQAGRNLSNFDIALHQITKPSETKSLELRFETFNTLNHAQFCPNGSVDGNISSPTLGSVLKAAAPRIGQVAMKFKFLGEGQRHEFEISAVLKLSKQGR